SFVETRRVAFEWQAAADPIAAVIAGIGWKGEPPNVHRPAGPRVIAFPMAVGIAGERCQKRLLLWRAKFFIAQHGQIVDRSPAQIERRLIVSPQAMLEHNRECKQRYAQA